MMALWLWGHLAHAGHYVVRDGDTIDSIAAALQMADMIEEIRSLNQLDPEEALLPGRVLSLPDIEGSFVNSPAVIVSLNGSGTMQPPEGDIRPMASGMILEVGTLVCTDESSFAMIRLVRQQNSHAHDDITLLSQTCLVVASTLANDSQRSALVDLQQGAVRVRPISDAPGEVIIRSEAGVTTGRTGGFQVTIEDEATRTEAIGGDVSVIGAGVEVAVDQGYGSRTYNGSAPEAVVKLLEAGQPIAPADGAILFRPSFQWTAATGALGYHVEIAADSEFAHVLMTRNVEEPLWAPQTLVLPIQYPQLWWRLSSFDSGGFQGVPSPPHQLSLPPGVLP